MTWRRSPSTGGIGGVIETHQPRRRRKQARTLARNDHNFPFQLHVNLVEVYVVVRDSTGIPAPDLKKEDFRLYDKGKLQTITNFAVETPESRKKAALAKFTKQIGENPAETSEKALPPDHFVAVMFDDTHLTEGGLMYARNSVSQFLDTLGPTERIGFCSTSGHTNFQQI